MRMHHSRGLDPLKFQDAHFTFIDLKKSVKAIYNKNDWCWSSMHLTRPSVFFPQTVLRAQLCWLRHFQTNMFSLHFTLLNLSDDISMALLFKIRICADIFLMHLINCWIYGEKVSAWQRRLMWQTSIFPSKKTRKGKGLKPWRTEC